MKPGFPRQSVGVLVLWAAAGLAATGLAARADSAADLARFGRIPVMAEGRIKPLDTVARTALLMFQGRQRLVAGARDVPPMEWLAEVLFRPAVADAYPAFRIDNADLLSVFNLTSADAGDGVRFSFQQLQPGLAELERQSRLAEGTDASERTPFQRAVIALDQRLETYGRLKYSVEPPDDVDLFALLTAPAQAAQARAAFGAMDTFSPLRVVPPAAGAPADQWRTAGRGLAEFSTQGTIDPTLMMFARMGAAWRRGDSGRFNEALGGLSDEMRQRQPAAVERAAWEARFNLAQPFFASLLLYLTAFLVAIFSWLVWPEILGPIAFYLMALALSVATVGIAARMWLEGRPPVTNLYSSALFIGWGAAGLCLILERIHRNAVASAAGSLIGFGTLVIAQNLALNGDTMEMMRAVLNSNFWLTTHVLTVTVGYAATFLAGFLAIFYIVRGVFTRSLDAATADSLNRMVYGIVCFATVFSFIGTVLGGIWADQSWGRFWGWDPKENGALIIVIWNAVILHVRWAGLARARGLMAMAVFGNVVTAWSWFGTNMLSVGLHTYGFTDAAYRGLITFVVAQLVIIGLAAVPRDKWRSPPSPVRPGAVPV